MINKIKKFRFKDTEITEIERIENGYFKDCNGSEHEKIPDGFRVRLKTCQNSQSMIINEVWLPDNWNGVFVGTGNGGMAGEIAYWMLMDYVKQGYVVANSDLGTSGGVERGIDNPEVWKDFGWRATHIMTVIAKALLKEYYGRKEKYSYFVGFSTGGEQALSEAQRFPLDYDGIIAGIPANNRIFLHTYALWNYVNINDKNGKSKFTEDEIENITMYATRYFQMHGDGEPGDDFITYPYINENTVDDFIDYLRCENLNLTKLQLDALKAVYKGPKNPRTGEQIYCGMPIGSEIYWGGMKDYIVVHECPHFYPFIWAFGKDYNGFDFDFDKDMDKINSMLSHEMNANNDDLNDFYKNGGKLITIAGSADPCVPYPDAIKYYNRVAEKMGGYEKICGFFKFFVAPGRDHTLECKGSNAHWGSVENRESLLDVLRKWREVGKEPDHIISARMEGENMIFARKTYPYCADKTESTDYPESCSEEYLNG